MAGISVASKTSNSVTLYISSLDETWNGATRTVNWYLGSAGGGIPTESVYSHKGTTSISGSPKTGGEITFNGLESGTQYGIYCTIYHGSNLLAELTGSVTTDTSSPTGKPTLTSCTYQTTVGSRAIVVKLVGTNIKGYTVTLGLSYNDGTSMTIISKRPITSDSFSTTIIAESFNTSQLSVVFDPGGLYAKTYYFPNFELVKQDYFEWSSAVAQGLPIKNVSHTEWDNFIDKIKEVLTDKGILNQHITSSQYGYAIGTTYNTMLNDCYLTYDTDLQGYPLTAKKFNVARFIIGSHISTNLEEPEKISNISKVLASDLIRLADCLKTWQG